MKSFTFNFFLIMKICKYFFVCGKIRKCAYTNIQGDNKGHERLLYSL